MTKQQASMKESAYRRQATSLAKVGKKVGSYFQGCAFCGDTEEIKTPSGRRKLVYRSGYNVYKAYNPTQVGWTHWCYDCGAKDSQAWSKKKLSLREKPVQMNTKMVVSSRTQTINKLEADLAELMASLKAMQK